MSNLMQGFALHTPTDNSASTTTLTAHTTNDNNMPMGAASSPSSSLQVSSSGEVYYPGSSVQQYGGSAAATAGVAGGFNGQQYRNNNNEYVNFNQFMMQHNFFGGGNGNGNSYQVPNAAMSEAEFNRASGGAPLPQQQQPQTAPNYFNYENNYSDLLDAQAYYGLHQQQQALPMKDPYPNPFAYTDATSTSTKNANPTDTLAAAASFLPQNGQNIFSNFCTDSYATFGDSNAPTTSASNSNYYSNPFAAGFDLKASKLQASAEEFVPRFDSLTLQDAQATAPQQNGESLAAVEDTSNQLLATNSTFDAATSNIEAVPEASTPSRSFSKAQTTNNNHNNNTNNGGRYQKSSENAHNGHTAGRNSGARQRNSDMYDDRGREDRYERGERGDRFASERYERGDRNARGNRQHRYDNHRQNKRRDDWNRNRDRINGFRVDEKYGNDNGSSSPLTSPEKKSNNGHNNNNSSPKAAGNQRQQQQAAENEKLSQREKLIRDIETRRLECLVCVETIGPYQSIWSCRSCYHIMHLQCIIKWASSSKSEDGWRCPACQNIEKEVPRDYFCFCGKVKNPHFNRQDTAHSCGEVCGRIEGCPHACTLLCHPGPCPPCQANVKRECGCGKTTQIMQCCLKKPIACDAICEKLLNCELHTCTAKCHEGKCEPCAEKVEQHCHCGKNERQVTCTRDSQDKRVYSCGKPCGKDLACGNHKCKDCCHAGECRPCKMSPDVVTSCPCGKMPVLKGQRSSCLDVIPTCEGVCNKTLRCGKASNPHHCTSKCHLGNCPPCNKQTAVKCRCGHMDQMIKCRLLSTRADDARCKKRCTKKRSCGKHKCNQECCIDIDHICPLPCNYTLSCGKHKCDQPCHRGNCPPCYRSSFEELYCECGAEVIYPPVPCGTKRPVCRKPCSRSHPCDHPPQHTCHSAATCPPCMILTTKWCFGKHEQRKTIPCSQESFSCGLPCNKPLPCGRHKCVKPCHEGPCQAAGEVCKQSCVVLRATCGHKCMAACHDGECPDTPCKETVEVQCECGNRKQMRACHDLVREFSRIATAQLASSMAEMQRGNYMELNEILQPVKLNKTNKTLDCNEECRLLERNRRLAIGLQVRNPDVPQKLQTKYSDFIRTFYKRDPTLVKNVHDALTTLVKLAKESKQKSRSHSFPTMNREKRQLVHEMCEMFGVDSVAYDKEPNRNVVATAFRDRSWLPAASIMEIMAREAGHRRVPVPSNNAWGLKR